MENKGKLHEVKQISANTQILFTVKSFFTLIGTILVLFFGFYRIVIVPKIDKTEEHYQIMYEDQKVQNRLFYEELGKINQSIGSLSSTIESLAKPTDDKALTKATQSSNDANNFTNFKDSTSLMCWNNLNKLFLTRR
jgi:hypothetical protein